jgi:hypothetical protein
MATVDSDKVVCGGIHAMIVAVLVLFVSNHKTKEVAVSKITSFLQREGDVHREVTYEIFENEMWRKLESKTRTGYHPSLVWTEIMSFIKVNSLYDRALFYLILFIDCKKTSAYQITLDKYES